MATANGQQGVAVVTGGAGGMGTATAKRLAAEGWPLLLVDLDAGRLEAVAAPLRDIAPSVEILAGDIADADFSDQLVAALAGRPVGALVHTAGLSPTMGDIERIILVDYDASARLAKAVCPLMAPGACAVMIASSSGYMMKSPEIDAAIEAIGDSGDGSPLLPLCTNPGQAYTLAKRAIFRLVEREASRFGARGARIMSISPGLIDTPMTRAEAEATPQIGQMLAKTPLGRYGASDEIATVAAFLCSPAASFVSGSDIKVDGGVLAALRG